MLPALTLLQFTSPNIGFPYMNINDLKPGDILLFSGRSMIGKLIRKLDGTEITHVGIFMGGGNVGESLMDGNAGTWNAITCRPCGSNPMKLKR
jgi:cell wall-associated NlpC family hydrolase